LFRRSFTVQLNSVNCNPMTFHIYTHRFSLLKSSLNAGKSYTVSLLLLLQLLMVLYCLFSAVIIFILDVKFLLVLEPIISPLVLGSVIFLSFHSRATFLLVLGPINFFFPLFSF
jgi:hypothetical protein